MALTSPGVEVTVVDQSQYLPAPTNSVPFVLLATAQNKADPNGVGIAQATTAANAGKLFQVTSQRDLTTLYGTPIFYTNTNGTPVQGDELNEYGLLAAYSLLGVTNRCYVLRADVDLSSLRGQAGRPNGTPTNGAWWLDTDASTWGINEWNQTTGKFTTKTPIVISDPDDMSAGVPIASIGNIGDYAVNAMEITSAPSASTSGQYFYKTTDNVWAKIGSSEWLEDWPAVTGTESNPTLSTDTFTIGLVHGGSVMNTAVISVTSGDTVTDVAAAINSLAWTYLSAGVVDGKLVIYSSQLDGLWATQGVSFTGGSTVLPEIGITAGTYLQPRIFYGTSAQQPLWQSNQTSPRPSGSVWIKVGGTGLLPVVSEYNSTLAAWRPKTLSLATADWTASAALDSTGGQAIAAGTVYAQYNFDGQYPTGPVYLWERQATGATVVTGSNTDPNFGPTFTAGSFVVGRTYTIDTLGTTNFVSIGAASNTPGVTFVATGAGTGTGTATAEYSLSVSVSVPGSNSLNTGYTVDLSTVTDATSFVTSWSAAGIPSTSAAVTTDGAIQLSHTEGGEIVLNDVFLNPAVVGKGRSSGVNAILGFVAGSTAGCKYGPDADMQFTSLPTSGAGNNALTVNVRRQYGIYGVDQSVFGNAGSGYAVGDSVTVLGTALGGSSPANDLVITVTNVSAGAVTGVTYESGSPNATSSYSVQLSNWVEFAYDSSASEPTVAPANNTNWYYSVVDEVDLMINFNGAWYGYRNRSYDSNGFPLPSGTNTTDPNGPIVSASEPTVQSDGTALVYGDIWIDTSDLENYPIISRWQSVDGEDKWVLIDNTDQTNATGIVFADARWAPNGTTNPTSDPIPTIKSLLTSNYLDLDAPEPSLYPSGMMLFNTRRSGFNVKQYRVNYFNSVSFPDDTLPSETSAWVSISGLQSNGAPFMGRKAQRAVVVASMRSAIDTNTAIRDEDNFFNLIATPNYPELQPNMVVLNSDRGETGYILGDTPMGLADSATDIQAWATNAAGATSTGEEGCVTRNTYLGLFYPSGIAVDLNGNEVAVPASHMMLRTFLRNDAVAYPWLAAAGTRRGIIDNALNIGYLNRTTGEFEPIKTRIGIRDVLYTNFINPLVFFTGNGLLNYGNKTSFNSQSALDRTNVARLVAYIRRQLTIAARPFVFEPNDALTRGQIAGVVESLMIDLVAKRGIYDYLVVCDESNNTPARIDRNELWIDVAVEPVKAAEFIYIPVRILNTGELASL